MGQPGIGAMLHTLGGGSENDPAKYYGRKIVAARMAAEGEKDREGLLITFEDGVTIHLWDNGQSCCESRYMTTDDNPADLVGQTLTKIEVLETKDMPAEYDEHQAAFLEVVGDLGRIVVVTHVEHNGYYGGFGLTITEEKQKGLEAIE